MNRSECVICHKPISWTFALCVKHEREYGTYASDQPDWVRYLVNDRARQRRAEKRDNERLVELDFIPDPVCYNSDFFEPVDADIIGDQIEYTVMVERIELDVTEREG